MPENLNSKLIKDLITNTKFEIAGVDQFAEYRNIETTEGGEDKNKIEKSLYNIVTDIQIRLGTLLKTDTVSFLFGAGASKECGGVLIGKIPKEIEIDLLEKGVTEGENPRVSEWLRYFYLAAKSVNKNDTNIPIDRDKIIERKVAFQSSNFQELYANFEQVLSTLFIWRSAIGQERGRIKIEGVVNSYIKLDTIDECLRITSNSLSNLCELPLKGMEKGFEDYKKFIRKVLTRPLNLKRVNIFTLNYDTLVEKASDAEGVVLIDGFVGTMKRVFRPESYDQDLYFPAETTEGRVHRHDRVIHLYKLHGSTTWSAKKPDFSNPYGLYSKSSFVAENDNAVIYPTPLKYGETLGMPYAELFRRFAASIVRPQSTLFVIGYGFGDDHVNAIIRQAIAVPSFTLVVVDPNPQNEFVKVFNEEKDQRVWIISGSTLGTFSGFVNHALPDLREEDIERKVISTHRALKIEGENKYDGTHDEQ
jgi:hypothetical protein